MSFSEQIKDEILNSKSNKNCCKKCIRFGELATEETTLNISEIKKMIGNRKCCSRAFIKGLFLGSGCIANPETKCHFEISVKSKTVAGYVQTLLKEFNVECKILKRKSSYVIYLKDADKTAMILRVINAPTSLMQFENARIEKSIKNDVNRVVNCETANMTKTIEASYEHIQAIDKLLTSGKINDLPQELKELCMLRKKNPELGLKELAQLCKPELSKSGVYHRLKKIVKLSE